MPRSTPFEVLRIHPDLPVCWETPSTIRVGFDAALARITEAGPADLRFISALAAGIRRERVHAAAQAAGLSALRSHRVLRELRPVLAVEPPPEGAGDAAPPRVHIDAFGLAERVLRETCQNAGFTLVDRAPTRHGECDLVICCERFLAHPTLSGRWLSLGVPHLRVRFTDRSVQIGPLVTELGEPCLTCADLALVDADPAIPALASQLLDRLPASEAPIPVGFAAAIAVAFAQEWASGDLDPLTSQWIVPVRDGSVVGPPLAREILPHRGCLCSGMNHTATVA